MFFVFFTFSSTFFSFFALSLTFSSLEVDNTSNKRFFNNKNKQKFMLISKKAK